MTSPTVPLSTVALAVVILLATTEVAVVAGRSLPAGGKEQQDDPPMADFLHSSSSRLLYLPIAISTDAVLAAMRAQAQIAEGGSGTGSSALENFAGRKLARAAAAAARARGVEVGAVPEKELEVAPAGIKRKMFWQPLGYMSASARRHNMAVSNNRASSADSGSNVFRYG